MDLAKLLMQVFNQQNLGSLSQTIGADSNATAKAINMALPILLSALRKNAQSSMGRRALANAIDEDHDGSILNNLGGLFGNAGAFKGASILKYLLGNQQGLVEQFIGKEAGLNPQMVRTLLMVLAPVLLGAIGKQKRASNMKSKDMGNMLEQVFGQAKQQAPKETSLIERMLDRDGDGSIMDDAAGMGFQILKNMVLK